MWTNMQADIVIFTFLQRIYKESFLERSLKDKYLITDSNYYKHYNTISIFFYCYGCTTIIINSNFFN